MKNDLLATYTSLQSEFAKCFVLSVIIGRVPMNSAELH
jgi:hypothetical protein